MAEAAMDMPGRTAPAEDEATANLRHNLRRVWLTGLGVLAIAGEQARSMLATLEEKGQELEPSVTAPFRRAGEAASRAAERAGESVRSAGSFATRLKADDLPHLERVVEEKVGAALQQLDLPTRQDLRALAERIEELAGKTKRPRESNA